MVTMLTYTSSAHLDAHSAAARLALSCANLISLKEQMITCCALAQATQPPPAIMPMPFTSIETSMIGCMRTGVDDAAAGHHHEVIEELRDVAVGLVDREEHGAARGRELPQRPHDGHRNLAVQSARRLCTANHDILA